MSVLSCFLYTVRPEVVLDPVSINVTRVEDNIVLSCSATGFPAPAIVWYHNNTAITTMGRVNITSSSSHYQTNSTITITSSMTNDTGDYYCNATNTVGTVSTSVALALVQGQYLCLSCQWVIITCSVPQTFLSNLIA